MWSVWMSEAWTLGIAQYTFIYIQDFSVNSNSFGTRKRSLSREQSKTTQYRCPISENSTCVFCDILFCNLIWLYEGQVSKQPKVPYQPFVSRKEGIKRIADVVYVSDLLVILIVSCEKEQTCISSSRSRMP